MLKVFPSFSSELTDSLLNIYQESLSKGILGRETLFLESLYDNKPRILLWKIESNYVSCVQCELTDNKALLYSLETAPEHRKKGYAAALVFKAIEYLKKQGVGQIYTHIRKNNKISLTLHKKLGFHIAKDSATLLDGTVSQSYYTLCYDVKSSAM